MTKKCTKRAPSPAKKKKNGRKTKNRPTLRDFEIYLPLPQPHQILEPIRLLFCTDSFCIHIYIPPKLYTILLSRHLKNQKVGHLPPPTK